MDISHIEARWRKELRSSKRTANLTRLWIGFQLLVGVAAAIFGFGVGILCFVKPNPEMNTGVANFVGVVELILSTANAWLICLVMKRVQASVNRRTTIHLQENFFTPLKESGTNLVQDLLSTLTTRIGLENKSFLFLRPKNSNAVSPSVVELESKRVVLVIPPNFLSLISSNRKAARAMLAHELGHIAQEDTRLWLWSSSFADDVVRVFLPFNILCWLVALMLGAVEYAGASDRLKDSLIPVIIFAAIPFPLFALWLFYSRIRRYRRRSEEMADLAAWILTQDEGDGLRECFQIPIPQTPTEEDRVAAFGFFGEAAIGMFSQNIHPHPSQRLQKIDHYRDVVSGRARRLKLTAQSGMALPATLVIIPAILLAILFPVFAQSKIAAKHAATISKAKQLGLSVQIYATDYDDLLPDGKDAQTVKAQLDPYLKNNDVWKSDNPNGGEFVYNYSLGGLSQTAVNDPANTPIFYESNLWDDGSRVVSFLDNHVKLVKSDAWQTIKPLLNFKPDSAKL